MYKDNNQFYEHSDHTTLPIMRINGRQRRRLSGGCDTYTQTQTVTDISTPCLSACVDNKNNKTTLTLSKYLVNKQDDFIFTIPTYLTFFMKIVLLANTSF